MAYKCKLFEPVNLILHGHFTHVYSFQSYWHNYRKQNISAKQWICKWSLMIKNTYGCLMQSTYAYYAWGQSLQAFCVGLSFCCIINSGTDSLIQNMFWLQKTNFQALRALHQVWRQPNNNALIWVAKLTWACLLAIGAVVKP